MRPKVLLSILTGLLLYLSWPVGGFAALLFIGFVPLLWVEHQLYVQRAALYKVFLLAYIAFVIWNFLTSWWLHYATVAGALFTVLVNAGLMSLVFWLYAFTKRKCRPPLALLFLVCAWLGLEKLHLIWEFAWPWLNLGNGFAANPKWIQWYEYTGTFGGSLWVWWVNSGVFISLLKFSKTKDKAHIMRGLCFCILKIGLPIAASAYIFSHYREAAQNASILVLQPNLNPYTEKFHKSNVQTARDLISLSQRADTGRFDYIIAPETALNKPIDLSDPMRYPSIRLIKNFTWQHPQTAFITGAESQKIYRNAKRLPDDANPFADGSGGFQSFNSALQIDAQDSLQVYHKSKLVAAVEVIPYRSLTEKILGRNMIDLGSTSVSLATQKTRSVFKNAANHFVAAPIICFESVFGEFVTGYVKNGANWLCIITNDGWWEKTQGYRQHLAYARLRAIENRRSVARSANTGVSAFISERGIVQKRLNYNIRGCLNGTISIQTQQTFYTLYGDYIARIAIFIGALLFLYALVNAIQSRIKA